MQNRIAFPFKRGAPYSFGELRAFESDLLAARRRDNDLSKALRDPKGDASRWMGLRLKETAPLKILADRIGWADDDSFVLMPEGDAVDVRVDVDGKSADIQFTLAAPHWRGRGYQQHSILKALNECECVSGYPPYSIGEDGIALGASGVLRDEDRWDACFVGLSQAIANKAAHDGRGCVLAVFAQEFYLQLLEPAHLRALGEIVVTGHSLSFESVCIFDNQPGFFIEFGEASLVQPVQAESEGR